MPDDSIVRVEQHLYEKRQKIYPREVHGLFARLRIAAALTLLGLYYGLPWLQWADRQAILFDLPARKFHILGLTFWPQDFIYLTLLLILAALSLFFFTTLAGRLWCGYACPQTVWTETFLWIERMVEGSRTQQLRLDKQPRSRKTLSRKITKHTLWIVFALWTGFTFVGYFTPIRELFTAALAWNISGWALFWILFYSFATYGNAGWMREQVCLYMCPYARFQSAMFDKNTLIISYDPIRGEPREKGRKRGDRSGDCVDCTLCVQACPTGIDIRDGLQYECIGCAACIDACDEVMDKIGRRKGLISYTTQNALAGIPTRVLRPRVLAYALVLLSLASGLLWSISQRTLIEVDVIRDRNTLYREHDNGTISNSYTLKILNKTESPQQIELGVKGLEDLILVTDSNQISEIVPIALEPGSVTELSVQVTTHYTNLSTTSNNIMFHITAHSETDLNTATEARFLGPKQSPD
ncbi:MAG: cytochrome c oxidase accessory protein CcoG [Granulosicoccus sp.]|nr:cytochrome c oxidase accessory protein CcoG [Granulosicoccus sp.]